MSENGKPVFEEAAAERELDELRRAIEETRARRRRANAAFEEFLKGFSDSPRGAAAASQAPAPPPRQRDAGGTEPVALPREDGLSAFAPAVSPAPAGPVTPPRPLDLASLDDFAKEASETAGSPGWPIPAALAPARPSPVRRALPLIGVAVVGVLAVFLWSRGGSPDDAAPADAAVAPSPAAPAPVPTTPPAATSGTQTPPPAAEVVTSRRVWMRVTVDGRRVVEREVPEGTRIPLNGSQIVIRAGDAGAVRVSIAGKDQGTFGPAGLAATRTFTVKP
jgi:cytoskeleton protein RodZ